MVDSHKSVSDQDEPSPEQLILNAAMEIMAEKKISGTRMRRIAERAGISPGTLHYYYPTKDDLFLAMLESMQASFDLDRRERVAQGDLSPAEKVRLFPIQQQRILTETPGLLILWHDFWGHSNIEPKLQPKIRWMFDEWRRDMVDVFREGVETGDFDPYYTHLAPFLLIALLEGGAMQYLTAREVLDLDDYFGAVYEVMLAMLGSKAGRAPYPTDIDDRVWKNIRPTLPPAKPGGRPAKINLREVVNAILYIKQCQCSWRMLPHDFPNWQTVYGYYSRWLKDGTLQKINRQLNIDLLAGEKQIDVEAHD